MNLKRLFFFFVIVLITIIACGKDDTGTVDCTNITPTYDGEIAAIMNSSCATPGCHSSVFPAEGIDLSSYEKVKSASVNGKVVQSIKHESGVKSMPQGLPKLSDESIKKVECWVKNGAPK